MRQFIRSVDVTHGRGDFMDKVNGNATARTFADRAITHKGHRSAVERALKAHREQSSDREIRTQTRIDRNLFLQKSNATPINNIESDLVMNLEQIETPINLPQQEATFINNDDRENFYSDLQIASSKDNAIALVEKERLNPENSTSDEVPKGSYVDFTV